MNTPFVYREAAPGQQAVSYAQMQANADLEKQKMVNNMYENILRNSTTQSSNMANTALTRSQMDRANRVDANRGDEFNRNLKFSYDQLEAQKAVNEKAIADAKAAKDLEHDVEYNKWLRYAESINARKLQPGEKLPAGLIVENGKVVPLMRPRVAATSPGIGSHMDDINAVRERIRSSIGSPTATPRSAEWVGPPMPSPGPRAPSPTDFRIPISQLGQEHPDEVSPYEQGYMSVIPQSELSRGAELPVDPNDPMIGYRYPERAPARIVVPFDEFMTNDYAPKRRLPGAFLPY